MPEYTLSNSAAVIDAAISSVAGADNTPTATSQNMVTSGGVKNYVDTAIAGVDTDTSVIEADIAALQTTVNSFFPSATLTLPTTTYYSSTVVTGWVESDPNGFINFTGSSTFSLNTNTAEKAGLYSATLVLTANDSDTGSDAFMLEFYRNGALQSGMSIDLNNAQNLNGGFRSATWAIEQGESWYVRVHEYRANTALTLSNTSIKVTKIT
jgi:hypothetical protein